MNLRDLHYFVVLAKVQHFGEAAKLCFVSQPTLSMQIKKLEEELDLVLFERNNKQVMLTEQGELLVKHAQAILNQVAEMKELARASADPFAGEIRLGVIPTLAPYLLPLVMPDIQKKFPRLRIWLIEEKTDVLTAMLTQGQLDAALMATPVKSDLIQHNLFDEPFYFVCSETSSLHHYQSIHLEQLQGQPVMLLAEGHCLREQAMALCQSAQIETKIDFTATSLETLRLMVQTGAGVTLIPALATQGAPNKSLFIIPFAKPAPVRTVALYWRPTSIKSICLQQLAKLITKTTQTYLQKIDNKFRT
ncbi:hydrogen peroxide-inducible genes activator [Legionella beliardensis]|uniref:Hydrogen peroxide-inducible genes activator n=1 Tax=Legionella beliardensis TaxID=91822 RepID=A0A378I332_9GAMM|nr:LysR substrate-binding domain-containing protein [Legionella beliardensis]STX29568.1 hydrogen peroxide-inducible genes activator [Legionella beliardensis]